MKKTKKQKAPSAPSTKTPDHKPQPTFHLTPRNKTQQDYIETIRNKELTFGLGPAGTGKTFLAVAAAVEAFLNKQVVR